MFDLDSFILGICLLLFTQLLTAIINDCFQSALLKRAQRKEMEADFKSENIQRPSARGVAQGVSRSE